MDVEYQEEYVKNSRGVQLFTCRWLPSSSPKALVFLCHGYGMECGNFMKGVGTKLASNGFAVFGIDYEGHGRSMGARCYIKRFDNIVYDCTEHFKSICAQEEYKQKKRFLYGESMGGAVALMTHKKDPIFWHGAILVAPMCKINEKVKPHPIVISLLTRVEDVIPKWKIVPTKDVIDSAFKDPVKREEIRCNKLIYQQKPRLKTALEMLRTSINLEDSLNEEYMPDKFMAVIRALIEFVAFLHNKRRVMQSVSIHNEFIKDGVIKVCDRSQKARQRDFCGICAVIDHKFSN
ncbi:hypothetical protein OROGR_019277 [Orobanche gracilis]